MMHLVSFITALFLLTISIVVSASSLPDPLNLQQVMKIAEEPDYYTLIEAESKILLAQSQREEAESTLGFRAQLELEAAYIEPSAIQIDKSNNDSSATLRLTQPLYDFGASRNSVKAADIEQQASQANMMYVLANRKLELTEYFFEVILSDLKYAWNNEALAVAYIRYEAVKDRHALSQVSDLELLESENQYLDLLHERNLSEAMQRSSRANLAEGLNRPGELPSNLTMPELGFSQAVLPEYTVLLEKILVNNMQLKLVEHQLAAAEQRMQAEQRQLRPFVSAELEVSEFARINYSEELRATLNVNVPLYEDSSIKSRISRARSVLLQTRSSFLRLKTKVRKQALNLWQKMAVLKKRDKQLITTQEFRELTLDKNRALYEMEVKTDLGDSMIAISEIQYKRAKNTFELALTWMQLRMLAGEADLMGTDL